MKTQVHLVESKTILRFSVAQILAFPDFLGGIFEQSKGVHEHVSLINFIAVGG